MSEKIRKRILLSLNGVAKEVFEGCSDSILGIYQDGELVYSGAEVPEELGYKLPMILELQAKTCEEFFQFSPRKVCFYDQQTFRGWNGIRGKFLKDLLKIIGPKSSIELLRDLVCYTFVYFLKDCDIDSVDFTEGYICNVRSKMFPNHPKRSTYAGQPDRNMIAV
jgi:hypothetical protein